MGRLDYQILSTLRRNEAYKKLTQLWLEDVSAIETKRDVAASKCNELSWRYYAGLEKGYKQAILRLEVELARLEEEGKDPSQPSDTIEKLLSEVRGDDKP